MSLLTEQWMKLRWRAYYKMIRVEIIKAEANTSYGKNATFLEGELYLGRKSKDGKRFVMRSEEGYWIPVIHFDWAKSGYGKFLAHFTVRNLFFLDNYKGLKGKSVY